MSSDADLEGALHVSGAELQFFANDRLSAPNTDAAYEEIEPAFKRFLDRLYDGAPYTLSREQDPKERLSFRVQVKANVNVDTLLSRLS
jgi:hypothetical protein